MLKEIVSIFLEGVGVFVSDPKIWFTLSGLNAYRRSGNFYFLPLRSSSFFEKLIERSFEIKLENDKKAKLFEFKHISKTYE